MNESRIPVRYSKALFQSALQKNILEKVYQDMIFIKSICSVPEVKELLTNPVITPSRKSAVLHSVLKKEIDPLTLSLVELTVKNGRERYIPAIARVFVHDTLKHRGITESLLTTAVKVDEKIKKQVAELIEKVFKTKVDIKENIDGSIVGGFILRVEDNYIDASIRNKLRRIKSELITGTYERRI